MNLKKIALVFISTLVIMLFMNTNSAYAEETVDNGTVQSITEDNTISTAEPVQDNTAYAEQDAVVNNTQDTVADTVSDEPEDTEEQSVTDDDKKSKKQNKKQKEYSKADLRIMSAIIYCEANLEPYAGKLAVGIVVMNRVESKLFPSDIRSVIYQRSQFSPVRNGSLKRALARYDAGKFKSANEKQCIKAAKAALSGEKTVVYRGKTKNMKNYKFFSGYLSGAKYRIGGHLFK